MSTEESLVQPTGDENQDTNTDDVTSQTDDQTTDTTDEIDSQTSETASDETSDDDVLFFGKYKTMEEAEKGFKELQSKLREKSPGAPEEYSFDFTDDEDFADLGDALEDLNPSEDPRFTEMEAVFKKHGLPQEVVNDIVKTQIKMDFNSLPDLEAEANALGEERDVILASAQLFVNKHLNADEQAIAVELGKTAAGVKLLNKMSKMVGEKAIPTKVEKEDTGLSSDELKAQAFAYKSENPRFEYDPMAQKRYDKMLEAALIKEAKEKAGK